MPRQPGERVAANHRLLGGIGFDVFLIAAASLLALALGLNPAQQRPQDDVEPVTRLEKKPEAAPAVTPARKPPRQDQAPPARNQYDSLRKAWGG